MDLLLAEDELLSRRSLEVTLGKWGYTVVVTEDGAAAWEILRQDNAPRLAILDWMMPGLAGPDVCRLLKQTARPRSKPQCAWRRLTGYRRWF